MFTLPKKLYHAYIVEGALPDTTEHLVSLLTMHSESGVLNPNLLNLSFDTLKLKDMELVREWHSILGVGSAHKICIISAQFISRDAENALLKILEEPNTNTHFFILIPDASHMLDTTKSRAHVLVSKTEDYNTTRDSSFDAEKFIDMSYVDRLAFVATVVALHSKEKESTLFRAHGMRILVLMEHAYGMRFHSNRNLPRASFVLSELASLRNYMRTSGASVKMLLEHMSLVL
jgi:DNA polymerase III, delta subunit